MPSQKNVQQLEKLKEKVEKASALFFVDYQGLAHQQLEEARRELRKNDSELSVVKNTLMNIALREEKNIDAKEKLIGAAATLFSYADPIGTAKVLSAFFKKYQLPKIRFGVFEGKLIDEATILRLASLPSREILLGKLVGILKSPLNDLVYSLNYNVSKLAFVLKAIEKKKS